MMVNYKKIKYSILLSFCISFLFALNSCREIYDSKYLSEGVIEYEVKYLDDETNYLAGLMPEKMMCYFKKNKVALDLNGGMGLFKTTFIFDNNTKSFLQLVKVMQNKYAASLSSDSVGLITNELPELTIKKTEEVKEIAGYQCYKALVSFKNPIYPSFEIFYTKDINIKNPNWCNPFKEIDGVLMEYRMKKYNMEMQITATHISKETVDDAIFTKPHDYKMISQKDLDAIISELKQ